MLEEETFTEFYTKLTDIVNSLVGLGEKIDEFKVVKKILRSLQKRIRPKTDAIEERKNVNKLKFNELKIYELDLDIPSKKKGLLLIPVIRRKLKKVKLWPTSPKEEDASLLSW